jgi:hypothetical protein
MVGSAHPTFFAQAGRLRHQIHIFPGGGLGEPRFF